ncbi:MAG: peptidyl-prolyl cis-trans isomerase [Candidatus Omnitrophica bacterium]|nr:peptidyl-prolyl cis-trans isomerase [Candidatus Omnitrophota bacterium]
MFKKLVYSKWFTSSTRWFFLVILIPPFALSFWAMGGRGRMNPGSTAGTLFGRDVPMDIFRQEYLLIRRNMEAKFSGEVPEQFEPFLRQQTWDRLILREEAHRTMTVSDDEVAGFIRDQTTFQDHGRFSPELYYRFVSGMGMGSQGFEERVRDDLRIRRLVEKIKAETVVTDADVRDAYAKDNERIRASLILTLTATVEPRLPPLAEKELWSFYAAHQDQWQEPAQRAVEYLGLSLNEALKQVAEPSDDQIQAYYDDHQDLFSGQDGKPKPLEAAREQVRDQWRQEQAGKQLSSAGMDLQDDLDEGLRFEEIALTRGRMIRRSLMAAANATSDIPDGPTARMLTSAFQVPLGHPTELLREPSGVFLLRPVEERPSRLRPFEEVRAEVERQARRERAKAFAKDRAERLHDEIAQLRERGLTLEEACLVAGAARVFPPPFSRNEPIESVGYEAGLVQALFALPLGGMTAATQTGEGVVIGFLEERLPFDEQKFEQAKDTYHKTALDSKQQTHLTEWLEQLRTKAKLKSLVDSPT